MGYFTGYFIGGSDIYMDMMNEDNLTATLAREISMKNYDYNWKDRVLHAINYSASIGGIDFPVAFNSIGLTRQQIMNLSKKL